MSRLRLGVAVAAACAAAFAQAASLHGVTPGASTRAEMHRALGEPAGGKGSGVEAFRPKDAALRQVTLYYDARDVVRRARFDPAAELSLELASLLFELQGKPRMSRGHPFDPAHKDGDAAHYDVRGVHFYLRDAVVREIWLVVPGDNEPLVVPLPQVRAPEPDKGKPETGLSLILPGTQPEKPPAPTPVPPTPAEPVLPKPAGPLAMVRAGRVSPGGARLGPAFASLVVGRATRHDVRAELGPPRFVSRFAPEGFACEYDGAKLGLRSIVVRLRPDGVVDGIEAQLLQPLPQGDAVAALGLDEPPERLAFEGSTLESFPGAGIELTVRDGSVTGLRLAAPPPPEPPKVAVVPPPPPPPPAEPVKPEPAPEGPPVLKQDQRTAADAEAFLGAQLIRVQKVWYKADEQAGKYQGLMVLADLAARGCKSQTMIAQVRLRHHDGRPVKAVEGAPQRFTDERGRFAAPAPDEVLFDPAAWKAYQVFLPYAYLDLPRGQVHHVVITFTATCGGHTNGLEAVCSFRLP